MKFQDVTDNVSAYMTGSGAGQPRTATQISLHLAIELGLDESQKRAGSTFDGQVRRSLSKLVDAGVLEQWKPRFGRREWRYEKAGEAAQRRADHAARQAAKEADEAAYKESVDMALAAHSIGHRWYGNDLILNRQAAEQLAAILNGRY